MKVLLYEFLTYGHSLNSLCLLLGAKRVSSIRMLSECELTFLVSDKNLESLQKEMPEALEGVEIRIFPAVAESSSWKGRWKGVGYLRKEIRRVKYDKIFVLSGDLLGVFAPMISFRTGCTRIWYQVYRTLFAYRSAGYPIKGYRGRRYYGPLLKSYLTFLYARLGMIDGFMFEDEAAVAWCRQRGFVSHLVRIPGLRDPQPHQADTRIRFTVFGVLSSAKYVPEILEAWGRLRGELRKKGILQLYGRPYGPEAEWLRTLVQRIGDDTVVYEERFLENREVATVFANTDVLFNLYSPVHVGCSAVLVQAAVCGIPVIASNLGWTGHMTRKYHLGRILEETSPEGIAGMLTEILNDGGLDPHPDAGTFAEPYMGDAYAESVYSLIEDRANV